MSKVTLASLSFVAGMITALPFLLLLGNSISLAAQKQKQAQQQTAIADAEPTVPPLQGLVFTGSEIHGGTQQLDGFECERCTFTDVVFTYAGGATRIVAPKFVGTTQIQLKGAAANTVATLEFLRAMLRQQKPPIYIANEPIIRTGTAKEAFSGDLVSPFGQKK